ncbi:MAG: DUF5362 family protein [Sediminibacterium sp.]
MENNPDDIAKLEVSEKLRYDLRSAAEWGKLIAILSFISSGMSLIIGFRKGSIVLSVIFAAISVFVYFFLFKFGAEVKKAIDSNDQEKLNSGLRNLETYFKILGVIMIIVLIICVLAIVFLMLGRMIKF